MNWQRAIAPSFLIACLLLGGASAAGLEANMLLQLGAVAIIALAFAAPSRAPLAAPARQLMALLALVGALIAVQLVPLPPALWTSLPGRAEIVEGYRLLALPLPWLPVSLAPHRTIASALWLLPAVAMLIAMIRLDHARLGWFAGGLVAATMMSVTIGALQAASGEGSSWYLYAITNYGVGTGFFANANHLATLLVATIPFLAAFYVDAGRRKGSRQKASAMAIFAGGGLVIIFIGLALNRSIAGLGLAVPVLAASGLMILARRGPAPPWAAIAVGLLIAGSIAVAFTAPFGNNLSGEQARAEEDSRYTAFTRTLPAVSEHLPTGSGIGTFADIYRRLEDPAGVSPFYMNHVHGDYIEIALETGVAGIALILLFLAWWGRRTHAVWNDEQPNAFARAATIATAAMLAHSVVDYPLRTAALGALFALCCAIMAEPRPRLKSGAGAAEPETETRHLSAD